MSENGILSGIPEDGGDYSFLVKVTDARRAQFDAKEFILHVEGGCTGEGFPQCLVGRTIAEVAGHFGLSCRPRGDINGDGRQDLSDAVFLLNYLFLGGSAPKPGKALAVDGPGACP